MQPVVLAWALLFVVAFALVYRLFAWISRRSRATSSPSSELPAATQTVIAAAPAPPKALNDTPVATAISTPTSVREPLATAYSPVASPTPRPAPARDYALAGSARSGDMIAEPKPPVAPSAPAPVELATPAPGPASAVISARVAGEAVRSALAPNVAATIPPRSSLAPSVTATLPPSPAVPHSQPQAAPEAALPIATTPPPAVPVSLTEFATLPPTAADAEPPAPDDVPTPKVVRLLARRVGAEVTRLDIRLRDSRERKIRRTPKVARKLVTPAVDRILRVLGRKASRAKTPERRVGQHGGPSSTLLSTKKTATKVVGASRRPSRVLSVAGT